jgi:hypothetical protein
VAADFNMAIAAHVGKLSIIYADKGNSHDNIHARRYHDRMQASR